jgi:hypothetical protein
LGRNQCFIPGNNLDDNHILFINKDEMTTEAKNFFKREISVGEMLGVVIMLAGLGITFHNNTSVTLSNHELRIKVTETLLEKEKADSRLDKTESRVEAKEAQRQAEIRSDKMDAKMDQVITTMNELKVEIQKKQDKK